MMKSSNSTKVYMAIAISGVLLLASLIVILTNAYPDSHSKWAFSTVGIVVGYWLR